MPYGQNQRPTISSSALSLWDDSSRQLKFSVMENGLLLSIWNPYFSPDGKRTYPQDQRYTAKIDQENVVLLEDVILNDIITAYEKGENCKRGIFTNSAHTTVVEIECRDGMFYFWLHTGVDPTTHIPQTTSCFKFGIRTIVTNFESGKEVFETESYPADFHLFAKTIRAYNTMAGGVIAGNGVLNATNYQNQKLMEYVRAIATATHAQLPTNNNVGNYGNNNGGYNNASNAPQTGTYQSTPQEVTDVTDLM